MKKLVLSLVVAGMLVLAACAGGPVTVTLDGSLPVDYLVTDQNVDPRLLGT